METDIKEKIKASIAFTVVLLLIITTILIVIKYSVEGETNMPFKLSKIVIGSMVVSSDNIIENDSLENEIIQNNGLYFEIKKNEKYTKDAMIKSVVIDNIQIKKNPIKGNVQIYIPNTTQNKQFTYSNDYILEGNTLTYKGASKSNTTTLEINNQGGIVAIAFGNNKLGTYTLNNEDLVIDGTMLKNMNITQEEIEFEVSFDFIINVDGIAYKSEMSFTLPCGDIINEGKSGLEKTDTSKYIFKRIKK